MTILDTVGYFGPQILLFSSIILLFKKWNTLCFYLIGYGSDIAINFMLKGIIQEPRPILDKDIFNIELLNGKRIGYDRYGCPSGHASSVVYSVFFSYFALQNPKILAFYLAISITTMYQRLKYNNHYLHQVIIGAIAGFLCAFAFYSYS